MSTSPLFQPLTFAHGPALKNRLVLAPMTNTQSFPDGKLSDDEYHWLTMRAQGGFALTITAASHVQAVGQGFPGQIGIFGDQHLEGLSRLAKGIKERGSVAAVQLHHAGNRSPQKLVGVPVSSSDDPETGARGLTLEEVEQVRDDFIAAAKRAEKAGFDGVQIHGAHGYILVQFLSPEINKRTDRYGGSLENRSRLMFEIIDGIRAETGPNFHVGLRLSPERFGLPLLEVRDVTAEVMKQAKVDYVEISAWDVDKEPEEEALKGRKLMSYFTEIERGEVRLGTAGKVHSGPVAAAVIESGCDFVSIGQAGILRHDFPLRVENDPQYQAPPLPVTAEFLHEEGVGVALVDYLRLRPGFIAAD
ncbi:NADH:flavin oxidoreductase [bacterium]|nr:MAG: NADH:flavin oxidoreductase [bacterium]